MTLIFIATNCKHLRQPDNACKHPTHQRARWSPLRWLGAPVACVFAYHALDQADVRCAEHEAVPRPAPPKGRSAARLRKDKR